MTKKKPSMKTVKKSIDTETIVNNCIFQNTTKFDGTSVEAIIRIAEALKSNADSCGALAKIFTAGAPIFQAMLNVEASALVDDKGKV